MLYHLGISKPGLLTSDPLTFGPCTGCGDGADGGDGPGWAKTCEFRTILFPL